MSTFLAGPIGSALRVFVGTVLGSLTVWLANGNTFNHLEWDDVSVWVGAAVAVALPIVIAALNPADPRFGKTGE